MGELLLACVETLQDCSSWLIEKYEENPEHAASGATPFLNMFGWVLGSWVMTESAIKLNYL